MGVSQEWNSIMRHDCTWLSRLNQLLNTMSYRSEHDSTVSVMNQYKFHMQDRKRTVLTTEELLGIKWHFRFKKAAGRFWVDQDPYWQGRGPVDVRFCPDGSTT